MSLPEINTRLQTIENSIRALSGMMMSSMTSNANDNRRFETYLRMIAKTQMEMKKDIGLLLANIEIRKAWDEEEGLDDCFNNFKHFNKEFK